MKSTTPLLALFALSACGSGESPLDASVDLRSAHDLSATGHCLASTPDTIVQEGACALAPPNGYCFVDFPQPGF